MTKNVPKKILRIERNFFVNLIKKMYLATHAAPRRARLFFGPGGAPPPPTEIDRRAAADTMTSAHSSTGIPWLARTKTTRCSEIYTLVAGLIYPSPSWWGFAGAADRVRLQAVLTRIGRLGYLPEDAPSIEQICSKADKVLFASVCHNPDHVLSHRLPPKKESVHALRPRVHDRVLPEADKRMRRKFLTRMLYSDYSCS